MSQIATAPAPDASRMILESGQLQPAAQPQAAPPPPAAPPVPGDTDKRIAEALAEAQKREAGLLTRKAELDRKAEQLSHWEQLAALVQSGQRGEAARQLGIGIDDVLGGAPDQPSPLARIEQRLEQLTAKNEELEGQLRGEQLRRGQEQDAQRLATAVKAAQAEGQRAYPVLAATADVIAGQIAGVRAEYLRQGRQVTDDELFAELETLNQQFLIAAISAAEHPGLAAKLRAAGYEVRRIAAGGNGNGRPSASAASSHTLRAQQAAESPSDMPAMLSASDPRRAKAMEQRLAELLASRTE